MVPDTLLVTQESGAGEAGRPRAVRLTVWAKHPMLLDAAEGDPGSGAGGAVEQHCCLNGYEAVERRAGTGPPARPPAPHPPSAPRLLARVPSVAVLAR